MKGLSESSVVLGSYMFKDRGFASVASEPITSNSDVEALKSFI